MSTFQGERNKAAFLAAFAECGNIRESAEVAGIGRRTHYTWLETDVDYAAAFAEAQENAVEALEAEARRRAVEGVEEPVGWYKGVAGGSVRRYSDNLLMFLLKGLQPDKYRERFEVRGSIAHLDLTQLPPDLLARIAAGEHPLAVLASLPDDPRQLAPGVDVGSTSDND